MDEGGAERLRFLRRVVAREAAYLRETDERLFARELDASTLARLSAQSDLSEQIDAFVARLSRLQDGVADKLLPALLYALSESIGPALDNLNRAERLGWLVSADEWVACKRLRNRLIHEYIEDPAILADALASAHAAVPLLLDTAERLATQVDRLLPLA
jgi:hypothetical protein